MEFAIVLPLLLLLVFGIIEFGLAFNRMQTFQAAAREAARLVSVGVEEDVVRDRTDDMIRGVASPNDVEFTDYVACDGDTEDGRVTLALTSAAQPSYAITIPFIGSLAQPDFATTSVFRCEGSRP